MKLNRSIYALIPIFGLIAIAISSFNYADSVKTNDVSDASWTDSIVVALQSSHILQVDGEILIVDSVPCASSVNNAGVFSRFKGSTYIDCTTCKTRSGKADLRSKGYCTIIRKYNEHKQ